VAQAGIGRWETDHVRSFLCAIKAIKEADLSRAQKGSFR
jgi:hypothetical protein